MNLSGFYCLSHCDFSDDNMSSTVHPLPVLDEDCLHRVLHFLDRSTIVTFARTSRNGSLMTESHLVRDVRLERSTKQLMAFCQFSLSRDVGSITKNLHIRGDAACRLAGETDLYWRCVVETLEQTLYKLTNLEHFSLHSNTLPGIYSLSRELPIAQTLLGRPLLRYLSVSGVDTPFLRMIHPIRGLHHLGIHVAHSAVRSSFIDAESIVTNMITNSIDTLTELSLSDIEPPYLVYSEYEAAVRINPTVRHLSLRHPTNFHYTISLERLALAFPNIEHLSLVKSGMLVGQSRSTLPIKSLKTDSALFPFQAVSDTLTRIEFSKDKFLADGSVDWTIFLRSIGECPITHLSLPIFLREPNSPCLSQLAAAIPNIEVLDLSITVAAWIESNIIFEYFTLPDLEEHPCFRHLQYLRLDIFHTRKTTQTDSENLIKCRKALAKAWIECLPSLALVEISMPIKWEGQDAIRSRLWWKRGKSGNAGEMSYAEGMSARERYRWESSSDI